MYARVTTFQVQPDRADEVTAYFQNETDVTGRVQGLPGFKQALMLIDRSTGDAMTVTLWETEGALQASADAAREIFSRIADRLSGEPSRRTYEVGALIEPPR